MKNFDIRKEFLDLKDFTVSIPETFDNVGSVILDNRNVIKKVTTPQGTLVVKNFKGMYFFNRVGYSLFAKSKAQKSFINSNILNEKGIITPPNVSWVDCYSWGLLTRSYFISVYSPYETLREVLRKNANDASFKKSLYQHLLKFIVKLHSAGVYHDDFSLSNILVIPIANGYDFSLVDLNRIRFKKISFRQGLQNFSKLEVPAEDLLSLIENYSIQAGQPPQASIAMFEADNARTLFLRRFRKTLRRYTLTPVEKLFKEGLPFFKQKRYDV